MSKIKNNVPYIWKTILFILVIILIDRSMGIALDYLYANSKAGVTYQEYNIIHKTDQPILILGSSRASYHYIPKVLSEKIGYSVFNAGREGTGKYFQAAVLEATLERYIPKCLIIDFDYREIYTVDGFDKNNIAELYPFYGKISKNFDSLLINDWYMGLLLQSRLYQYNKKIFHLISGNLIKGRDNIMGYRPLHGTWKKNLETLEQTGLKVDPEKIAVIERIVEKAFSKNIEVIFTISPYYKKIDFDIFSPLDQLANKYNIQVFNYLSDSRFIQHPDLFHDELHLNEEGATIFSTILADKLIETNTLKK